MKSADGFSFGRDQLPALAVVVLTLLLVGFFVEDTGLALALGALLVGLYLLHLLGLHRILKTQEQRWEMMWGMMRDLRSEMRREPRSEGRPAATGAAETGDGDDTTGSSAGEKLWRRSSPGTDVPIPRKFALGTVALIRKKLTPAEIDRVLKEQKSRPEEYFGELAIELGYLNREELEELLDAQKEGLFTDAEIQDARRRLKAYQSRMRTGR